MSEQISGNEIDLEAVGDDIVNMPDRLDLLLVEAGVVGTRTKAQKLIKAGKVTVNGKAARASYDVKVGDELTVTLGAREIRVRVLAVQETVGKSDAAGMYEILS